MLLLVILFPHSCNAVLMNLSNWFCIPVVLHTVKDMALNSREGFTSLSMHSTLSLSQPLTGKELEGTMTDFLEPETLDQRGEKPQQPMEVNPNSNTARGMCVWACEV